MRFLLLLFFAASLFGLELSVQTGKEDAKEYSILHLKSDELFFCEANRDDFGETTQVICAFDKRPINLLKTIENNFFHITSKLQDGTFFIIVKPLKKMQLRPILFDLVNDNEIYQAKDDYAKHWIIIGYEESPPFLAKHETKQSSINFPVLFSKIEYPSVGALDIYGKPIKIARVKDVSKYLQIKRSYEQKRYEDALKMIEDVLEEYPDTIFKSELMLYQIRCYHALGEAEPLIMTAKRFIRSYSSDMNMAEVLADIADAYSKIALYTDADYFFDRLFDEHKGSRFATIGLIYKGDQLYGAGNIKKAKEFYIKALHAANDKEIAAEAAYKIVKLDLEYSRIKSAKRYVEMILQGDKEYFVKMRNESVSMANKFAANGDYETATKILEVLVNALDKSFDGYEDLLKNYALYLAHTDDKERALDALNLYLQKYKFGSYIDEIKKVKDSLFFDMQESNATQKLARYDLLIEKYENDSIAMRALLEKAKLLYELGRYEEVLAMQEQLSMLDNDEEVGMLIQKSAMGLIERALEKNECVKVVDISKTYDINLSQRWDDQLFQCYLDAGDYNVAKRIAQKYIRSKEFDKRVAWLERYIKIDFALGNYTEVLDAAKELLTLQEEKQKRLATYRILFDAAQRVGDGAIMLDAIRHIESLGGLAYEDIERYAQTASKAKELGDSLMLENYAKKVIALQQRTKTDTQSPYIEFTLTQAYMEDKKYKKALATIRLLEDVDMSAAKRSRAYYIEGSLYNKLGKKREAKAAFEKSMQVDADSTWAKLAKDAISLIE